MVRGWRGCWLPWRCPELAAPAQDEALARKGCLKCRTHLKAAISHDNGVSWRVIAHLEDRVSSTLRFHYPTLQQVGEATPHPHILESAGTLQWKYSMSSCSCYESRMLLSSALFFPDVLCVPPMTPVCTAMARVHGPCGVLSIPPERHRQGRPKLQPTRHQGCPCHPWAARRLGLHS